MKGVTMGRWLKVVVGYDHSLKSLWDWWIPLDCTCREHLELPGEEMKNILIRYIFAFLITGVWIASWNTQDSALMLVDLVFQKRCCIQLWLESVDNPSIWEMRWSMLLEFRLQWDSQCSPLGMHLGHQDHGMAFSRQRVFHWLNERAGPLVDLE